MELIGVKENPIKIKRTIFNMDPRIEKTTKIARNVDSGLTQLQQLETLLHTLLRLEAIRADAYERWQPFFNQARLNFMGLLAYFNVFHKDQKIIHKLSVYFTQRRRTLQRLRHNKNNKKDIDKLQSNKSYGIELMEELRAKIYLLQTQKTENFQKHSAR